MVHKTREKGKVVKVERRIVYGEKKRIDEKIAKSPGKKINTSYIERSNGTLRQTDGHLRRKSQTFAKEMPHFQAQLAVIMGLRDDGYSLCGTLELDEGFFSVEVPEDKKGEPKKRGRGSQSKATVLVMVESEPDAEAPDKGKGRKVGYLKMKVISDLKSETVTSQVREHVSAKSCLDTDDSTSYVDLKDIVSEHRPVKVADKKQVGKVFPWVHIAIANAKRWLLANHHDIKMEYLQFYLNEFCYKFNRRYFGEALLDRLMICAINHKNEFRYV